MSVWTTPTTRSVGEGITAAKWNTDITENLKFLMPQTTGAWATGGSLLWLITYEAA